MAKLSYDSLTENYNLELSEDELKVVTKLLSNVRLHTGGDKFADSAFTTLRSIEIGTKSLRMDSQFPEVMITSNDCDDFILEVFETPREIAREE